LVFSDADLSRLASAVTAAAAAGGDETFSFLIRAPCHGVCPGLCTPHSRKYHADLGPDQLTAAGAACSLVGCGKMEESSSRRYIDREECQPAV